MPIESRSGKDWTRDELIFALGLYFQIPFKKICKTNKEVVRLSQFLGRSPASLSMKMDNLARFDPTLQAKNMVGLSNGSKMDEQIWREFENAPELLAQEYARVRSLFGVENDGTLSQEISSTGESVTYNLVFFRQSVLSAYDNTCCLTNIDDGRLLFACHIKPPTACVSDGERMDPQNGICFNALYGRAFEQGLITVDQQYKIVLSPSLKEHMPAAVYGDLFRKYDNTRIRLPDRGKPNLNYLAYHNEHIFAA